MRIHANIYQLLHSLILALALLAARPTRGTVGDEHWDPQFGLPGVTNNVFALLVDGGFVYAGGLSMANTFTNSLDRWDGQRWSGLGQFIGGPSVVYAMVRQGTNIYAGGIISRVNGVTMHGLVRWNGSTWAEVGGGISGAVFALAVDGPDLYVGGSFTNVGGMLITNVARWDGANWHPLGSGIAPYCSTACTAVRRLVFSGSTLHAAGTFSDAGGLPVQNIASWNGTAWTDVGGGVPGSVSALAVNGSDIYVGGTFTTAGGVTATNVARWNGTTWSAVGAGFNGTVNVLTLLNSQLYAGGNFTSSGTVSAMRAARFDGVGWSSIGAMSDQVYEIVRDNSSLIFGGPFTQANDLFVNHAARFDGTNWSALNNANRDAGAAYFTRSILAVSNRVYLGGIFTGVGGARASRIACWNGTNWQALGSGLKGTNEGNGTAVNAILVQGNDVYVGGVFTNAGGISANSVALWNGTNWTPLGSGVNGSVLALAAVGSDIYVGGNFTSAGGITAFNIARWNGTSWAALPPPFSGTINNFFVSALAVMGNDLYIGGSFSAGDGSQNIARFSNGQWFQLAGNVDDRVSSLAVMGTNLYVGGRFINAGGVMVNRIAKWNGTTWSALGAGVGGGGTPSVNAMAVVGTNLYAGGTFTNIGGIYATRLAKWDGSVWSLPGSGLTMQPGSPAVTGLAASGENLYVAGTFVGAGGKSSSHVAHWNEQIDFDLQPTLRFSTPQRMMDGGLRFDLTASGVAAFVIETTTNFGSWVPLLTNTAIPFTFTHTNPAGSHLFYRARSQ